LSVRALLVLALLVTWAQVAVAQDAAAAAEALFIEGKKELDAGHYDIACAKLRESDRLDPAVGTKLNLADCERKRGRVATAWALFVTVRDDRDAGADRHLEAENRLEEIEGRVPWLTLRLAEGAPGDTTATIAGVRLGAAGFGAALPVDPGPQTVIVAAPGHAEQRFTVNLAEGQRDELLVAPGERLPEPPPSPDGEPRVVVLPAADGDALSSTSVAGFAVGGVSLAILGVAAVTGALTLARKDTADGHCSDELQLCDAEGVEAAGEGRSLGVATTALLVTGGLGLALGVVLLVVGIDDDDAPARTTPGGLAIDF
jgi:hypothetical protein